MTSRRTFWCATGTLGSVALLITLLVPDLAAQWRSESLSLPATQQESTDTAHETLLASASVPAEPVPGSNHKKINSEPVSCSLTDATLVHTRQLVVQGDAARAQQILRAMISPKTPCTTPENNTQQATQSLQNRARLQLVRILQDEQQFQDSLDVLNTLEDETPIQDYVHWLKATALSGLGQHAEAADHLLAIYNQKTSPLHWRARTLEATARVEAGQWKQALPVLTQTIDLFPDYPRRHALLFGHARALDALDKKEEAAVAYQQTWFEFPFKQEGELARKRLEELAQQNIIPPPIARERLLSRFRQLRVDKHWPLAHELLTELHAQHQTESGNTAFEIETLLEIALNRYYSHDFEGSLPYFARVRAKYEEGFQESINARTLYRFQSFAFARLQRFDEALQALEVLHKSSNLQTRLTAFAEFYEEHGLYKHALDIYDKIYSPGKKRGWHYTWLLYKSGKFDQAYESLIRLAERSGGERRAKYLYWAARSLERGGDATDARAIFAEVQRAYPSSYYGIQATNRVMDIAQREAAGDKTMLVEANTVLDSSAEAFQAFDEATTLLASTGTALPPRDPRMTPIDERASTGSRAEESNLTDTENGRAAEQSATDEHVRAPGWPIIAAFSDRLMADAQRLPATPRSRAASDEIVIDDDEADGAARAIPDENDAQLPTKAGLFARQPPRVHYTTDARIYWHGRQDSDIAFVKHRQGEPLGAMPATLQAYDEQDYIGGIHRAVEQAGDLFPELERAMWLWHAGLNSEARRAIRDVALEFRGLSSRARPTRAPHELDTERWAYYIDNRRAKTALWGMKDNEKRFPVPQNTAQSRELLARQQAIFDARSRLEPVLIDAFMELGEHHLVRRHALSRGGWSHQNPRGPMRRYWMQAYPRAFPEIVIPEAIKNNVNPYMIWALMLVESSFNPDSLSRAEALGLLQVIPRTGLKVAAMFGDEEFGPYDLLDEETAIRQGVFYFSHLVRKFHGQELLAFAGYNGGPHRVGSWLESRGRDIPLDEFIEEIPFTEARGYAKKVLRFVNVYMRIYENTDHLYVGQNLRQDYLAMPDF